MNPQRLHDIMSGGDGSLSARLLRLGLSCGTPWYRAVIAGRNAMFDWGLRRPVKLTRPVISIGNLTTGGTGKTPLVIELARWLLAMNEQPGILTRGYRGTMAQGDGGREGGRDGERTSDEVELFRAEFGETVPVAVNANRVAGAASMLARKPVALQRPGEPVEQAAPAVSVFLLDDGFQHRQVARDLDIVLIDATQPFGYGRLLPRGLLREPVRNLRRADAVIITRSNEVAASIVDEIAGIVNRCKPGMPVVRAEQRWHWLRRSDGTRVEVDALAGLAVFAFTGIGNPAAFEKMLRRHAGDVRGVRAFADHHAFSEQDVRTVLEEAKGSGAQAVVTTEKDWTKIATVVDWQAEPVRVFRPELSIAFDEGEQWRALEERIKRCLGQPGDSSRAE